jgi:hypothetical protein
MTPLISGRIPNALPGLLASAYIFAGHDFLNSVPTTIEGPANNSRLNSE